MLIEPYGQRLVDLMVSADERGRLFDYAAGLRSIQLTQRQTCDLEMLAIGAFSPVRSFMGEGDYGAVVRDMRLADGTVLPIPITLSTDDVSNIGRGSDITLRNAKNDVLAVISVDEIYEWDPNEAAERVYGTRDLRHPVVSEMRGWGKYNLSGPLQVLRTPVYHDFEDLRLTPAGTREQLAALGRGAVVAFQTRNPLHRAHEEMTRRAIDMIDGTLLLHPAVGMTKEGDIDYFTRVRTYRSVADLAYPKGRVLLAIAPLAMRLAGPREAVWHAIIRRNYGASHFIVGRDHASPGLDAIGRPFYEPSAAQELAAQLAPEIGVEILKFEELVYLPDEDRYEEIGSVPAGRKFVSLSGTGIRANLSKGDGKVPEWFMRKEIVDILTESSPPRQRQGVCIWFTGLSGAGKTTTAEILVTLLLEAGRRSTLLDGDVIRTHLSKGLGFSREDRDTNVQRIGFVASEIVRHGGVAICAAVSPYRETRSQVRQMFEPGQFVEVFVDTPIDVCEDRDRKGMYAKARRGELDNFTGVSDVYELPDAPEITLNTVDCTAMQNARSIVDHLRSEAFLRTIVPAPPSPE